MGKEAKMSEYRIDQTPVLIPNQTVGIEFDDFLRSRVVRFQGGRTIALDEFSESHYLKDGPKKIGGFLFRGASCETVRNRLGEGGQYTIVGRTDALEKKVILTIYKNFPSTVFMKAQYRNVGDGSVKISGWVNGEYSISSQRRTGKNLFWSFQGASYEERPDWVLPLQNGYFRKNFMGMNQPDYGGGIPVSDVWDGSYGIAVGHCAPSPELVSLPVEVSGGKAVLSVCSDQETVLAPGETLRTLETFVTLHGGDFFETMVIYRRMMEFNGIKFAPINREAYEPTWCSWGYERNFTVQQIYRALPKVKQLGFKWICVDDGWQNEEGDYQLSKEKFPTGEEGIKELVRKVHEQGFKIQLWWVPMACDPKSIYFSRHPESVILDRQENKQEVSWWDNYYLCPACEEVKEYTKETVKKILQDWDFDGLKIDGQHLNAAPPCYNKAHHHSRPEESFEAVPGFFRMIYEDAKRIKPDALIMFCPCGTCCSVYTMPYFDMPVASDPESSWQVRLRGKTYKALMGGRIPYNGDHVELSDDECDFASTVGIGGVINTKFTWPVGSSPVSIVKEGANFDLDPEKEALYRRWLRIYREKMLPEGEYLGNLYCLGFDVPECHVIKKDGKIYYAFYAADFSGEAELKGLGNEPHVVYDYVHDREVARLGPSENRLHLNFEKFALLEVSISK